MNLRARPKPDVAAGTATGKARRRLGVVFVGSACLLGAGVLALQQRGGGLAWSHDDAVETHPGASGARQGMSPHENRVQSPTDLPTAASRETPFRQSFAARLAEIRAVPDESAQEEQLERLVGSIAVEDFPRALAFLERQEVSDFTQSLEVQLLRRWAEASPLAAATWVGNHASETNRRDQIRAVALVWADQSLPEALAWVRQLPESAERNTGLIALAYEAARSAPMEAFRVLDELPDGQVRNDLIKHTASQWADQNPQEAVAWASQVGDEICRQQLLVGITTAWADKEPAAAATAAANLLPPGRPQDDAVIGIVQRWVQTEPAQAADWVLDFPRGPLQDTAFEEVVKLWADQDPARTGEWINQLDDTHRDSAVAAYAGKLAPNLPDSAAEWAGTIGDETLRNRLMETVAVAWLASDPAAARRWVATAELTEAARAQLLKPAEN